MPTEKRAVVRLLAETKRLRVAFDDIDDLRFWWTTHGRVEMANDQITAADIDHVCQTGSVTWVEWKSDELWHVEGRDLDGRSIRIVLALIEEETATVIKVITAMAL
jgi:hypothetical protein